MGEEEIVRIIGIAKGRVQGEGFKQAVKEIADEMRIAGSVETFSDGTAEIIAEGTDEKVQEFSNKVRDMQYPIEVRELETTYSPKALGMKGFEII